jgi:two-component sensor histidine kinase
VNVPKTAFVPTSSPLDVRLAALRVGSWLGWLSVAAVLAGLLLGLPAEHDLALIVLIGCAAVANAAVARVPQAWWTTAHRGDWMLQLWSAGLVSLTATLVLVGGGASDLDLLLFLILPFLATVHTGARRAGWLAVALASFLVVMVLAADPLPSGQVALRGCLLVAATALAIVLGELTRRAAATEAELRARAELEHALLAEAHHRIKNSLQTVGDLLLLGRPDDGGRAFDETAERIRAIAVVHRLLAEQRGDHVDAASLLELIADGHACDARLRVADVTLDPTCAQHLGIVANELIANAVRHGERPIDVALGRPDGGAGLTLTVGDAGRAAPAPADRRGLGLQLVERVVERGLHGTFAIGAGEDGTTRARVTFDPEGGT